MRLIVSAAFIVSLTLPAALGAQGLGEAAAKERERREKLERDGKSKAPKVYTESDLRGRASSAGTVSQPLASGAASETGTEGQPTAAAAPTAEKKEPTDEERRAEQQQAWRDNISKARQDVATQTDRLNKLQASLNDVSGNLYGTSRATLLSQLDAAKKELAAAQQRVTDLEEEGRRAGYR